MAEPNDAAQPFSLDNTVDVSMLSSDANTTLDITPTKPQSDADANRAREEREEESNMRRDENLVEPTSRELAFTDYPEEPQPAELSQISALSRSTDTPPLPPPDRSERSQTLRPGDVGLPPAPPPVAVASQPQSQQASPKDQQQRQDEPTTGVAGGTTYASGRSSSNMATPLQDDLQGSPRPNSRPSSRPRPTRSATPGGSRSRSRASYMDPIGNPSRRSMSGGPGSPGGRASGRSTSPSVSRNETNNELRRRVREEYDSYKETVLVQKRLPPGSIGSSDDGLPAPPPLKTITVQRRSTSPRAPLPHAPLLMDPRQLLNRPTQHDNLGVPSYARPTASGTGTPRSVSQAHGDGQYLSAGNTVPPSRSGSVGTASRASYGAGARGRSPEARGSSHMPTESEFTKEATAKSNGGVGLRFSQTRSLSLAAPQNCITEHYYTGGGLGDVATIAQSGNTAGAGLRSKSPRMYLKPASQLEAPEKLPNNMADQIRVKGNSGVAFSMTAPRCGNQRYGSKAIPVKEFRTVKTKEPVWQRDTQKAQRLKAQGDKLMIELEDMVVDEELDNMASSTKNKPNVEAKLKSFGYDEKKRRLLMAYIFNEGAMLSGDHPAIVDLRSRLIVVLMEAIFSLPPPEFPLTPSQRAAQNTLAHQKEEQLARERHIAEQLMKRGYTHEGKRQVLVGRLMRQLGYSMK